MGSPDPLSASENAKPNHCTEQCAVVDQGKEGRREQQQHHSPTHFVFPLLCCRDDVVGGKKTSRPRGRRGLASVRDASKKVRFSLCLLNFNISACEFCSTNGTG